MQYTKEQLEKLKHRWTTNKGKKLLKTIKESRCYLSPVLFREKVHNFPGINDPELEDKIDLRGAPLSGFDFRSVIKDETVDLQEKIAIISNIHFEGAVLKHCNFQDGKIFDCNFENTDASHCEFKGATLNNCNFKEADCTGLNFRGAKLISCDFSEATVKDLILDSTIVDEKTTFGKILKSEKEGSYHFASIEYKQIKEMYKNSSLHQVADHYHYKEMVSKRKISPKQNIMRILNYIFGDLLCKYGTSFINVILWSLLIIILCAALFTTEQSLLYQNTVVTHTFLDSLYFSIVSFTTLGYGDYHAVGWLRFLAAAESFIGAAMMALFTVIVARQIIRD